MAFKDPEAGQTKRQDPPPRPVEGVANRGQLEGKDPTKHYVYVSEVNDPTINVSYYRSLGYKVSQYDPGDAIPTIGNVEDLKQGDPIKSFGCVLMEIPAERKAELDAVGWDRAKKLEDTVRHRDIDPLSPGERAAFKGITSVRTEQDDRKSWQF